MKQFKQDHFFKLCGMFIIEKYLSIWNYQNEISSSIKIHTGSLTVKSVTEIIIIRTKCYSATLLRIICICTINLHLDNLRYLNEVSIKNL